MRRTEIERREGDDFAKIMKWAIIENIVILIVTFFGCWLVSQWFFLILLCMNSIKLKNDP